METEKERKTRWMLLVEEANKYPDCAKCRNFVERITEMRSDITVLLVASLNRHLPVHRR